MSFNPNTKAGPGGISGGKDADGNDTIIIKERG